MDKSILKNCRADIKLPDIIQSDYGIGITFKDEEGVEYTTIKGSCRKERVVNFTITSWVGISPGAVHHYGKMVVYEPDLEYYENGELQHASIGGYFNRHKPDACKGFSIELIRTLTQEEIDEDPRRWDCYEAGDNTNCFYTEEEVYELGERVFKARFRGDWVLEAGGTWTKYKNIKSKKK